MADIVSDTVNGLKSRFPQYKPFLFDLTWKFLMSLNSNRSLAPKGNSGERRELFHNAGQGYIDGYRNARDEYYDGDDDYFPERVATSSYWPRVEAAYPSALPWQKAHAARFIDHISAAGVSEDTTFNDDAAFYATYGFLGGFLRGCADRDAGKAPYQDPELSRQDHMGRIIALAVEDVFPEYANEIYTLCGEPDTDEEMEASDFVSEMLLDIAVSSAFDCLTCLMPDQASYEATSDEERYILSAMYLDHFCMGFFDAVRHDVEDEGNLPPAAHLETFAQSGVEGRIYELAGKFGAASASVARIHAAATWLFELDASPESLEEEGDDLVLMGIAYSAGVTAAMFAEDSGSGLLSLSKFGDGGGLADGAPGANGHDIFVDEDGNELELEPPEDFRCEYDENDPSCLALPDELAERGYTAPVVEEVPFAQQDTDIVGRFHELVDAFGDFTRALHVLSNDSLFEIPSRESLARLHENLGGPLAGDEKLAAIIREAFSGGWPRILRLAQIAAEGGEIDRRVCVLRKQPPTESPAEDGA